MAAPIFPTIPGLAWPVKRTIEWSSVKQEAASGVSPRFPMWTYPRYKYSLSAEALRQYGALVEYNTFAGFFNQLFGGAGIFQFQDSSDFSATAQTFGTGDGTTTAFQLMRSVGGFSEPVFAPVTGYSVYDNGTLVAPANYTDNGLGKVTFTVAPLNTHALTWTGTYNWLCQFDEDMIELSEFASGFWGMDKIEFTTVKF